jgi:hydroxyacylglutathione hydrolase
MLIHQFPCLKDNYGFLVHDPRTGATVAIDTPDTEEIERQCEAKGWRLTDIWNTHWHPDHAGGNATLKAKYDVCITGPAEVKRIGRAPDRIVSEGDVVKVGGFEARVLEVGGHTQGHIAFVFETQRAAFVGDTLFSLGCGRLFEGAPQQMWQSLSKLAALPDEMRFYCAHEYTLANAHFAMSVDAANPALQARVAEVQQLRSQGSPTVPVSLGVEKKTNPFLRAPLLKAAILLADSDDCDVFAELRSRKDAFNA